MRSHSSALRDFAVGRRVWLLSAAEFPLPQGRCPRHRSTVARLDRLVEHGAVTRRHSDEDRHEVLIELTPHDEEPLHQLSVLLWQELKVSGPALSESLSARLAHSVGRGRNKHEPNRPRKAT
jgi:hypothetical protein